MLDFSRDQDDRDLNDSSRSVIECVVLLLAMEQVSELASELVSESAIDHVSESAVEHASDLERLSDMLLDVDRSGAVALICDAYRFLSIDAATDKLLVL